MGLCFGRHKDNHEKEGERTTGYQVKNQGLDARDQPENHQRLDEQLERQRVGTPSHVAQRQTDCLLLGDRVLFQAGQGALTLGIRSGRHSYLGGNGAQ